MALADPGGAAPVIVTGPVVVPTTDNLLLAEPSSLAGPPAPTPIDTTPMVFPSGYVPPPAAPPVFVAPVDRNPSPLPAQIVGPGVVVRDPHPLPGELSGSAGGPPPLVTGSGRNVNLVLPSIHTSTVPLDTAVLPATPHVRAGGAHHGLGGIGRVLEASGLFGHRLPRHLEAATRTPLES